MKEKRTTSIGITVLIAAFTLGVISILGLVVREKAVLLHFPGIIISLFLAGIGFVLITGIAVVPTPRARGNKQEKELTPQD